MKFDDEINSKRANSNSLSVKQPHTRRITKFGSFIFDKLLNIKDKVEHKKVLEMK